MSKAFITGNNVSARVPAGTTRLPVGSVQFGAGIAVVGDTWRPTNAGNLRLEVILQAAGVMTDVPFNLEVFNETGAVVAASQAMAAPGNGKRNVLTAVFGFAANGIDFYSLRITTLSNVLGENLNQINLAAPQYRADLMVVGGDSDPGYRNAIIDGGGVVLVAGNEVVFTLANAYTIRGVRLIGDVAGTVGIEFQRSPWATYPGGLVSLTGGAGVALVGAQTVEDLVLAGWTTALQAGDVIRASVMAAPVPVLTTRVTTALDLVRA